MSRKKIKITVTTAAGVSEVAAEAGETVLEALRSAGGPSPAAPCAGRGRCGRCRIILDSSAGTEVPDFHPEELKHLDVVDRENGVRLSCLLPAADGMFLRLEERGVARIETRAEGFDKELNPVLARVSVVLPAGSLEDQRPVSVRAEEALGLRKGSFPHRLLSDLPAIPDGKTPVSFVVEDGRQVAVDTGLESNAPVWAAAVDIGTTTVAMYLVDLADGVVAGSLAEMNAQGPFGADVISRLEHARKGREQRQELQNAIVGQLESLLGRLCSENSVAPRDVHLLGVAGNTAMMHLMAGWDATGLGEAPFLPAALEVPPFEASTIGLNGFPRLRVWPLPSLSAYVGADITGGLVASGMKNRPGIDLLLDIGTNGEIALGGTDGLLCCSTAAGPAFEGAHLSFGSGSIPGAVDHVEWKNGRFSYTTIDNLPAVGFCGSGVVDLVAFLVRSGLVDETGRIEEDPAALGSDGADEAYAGLNIRPGSTGAELTWPGDSGKNLGFTQKDLREVQLAKAAIRAGIDTLLTHARKTADDIGTLWLAGGFGSYIRPESAAAIGLIPPELAGKTKSLGNAAARGALLCLLSKSRKNEAAAIAAEADAIELSGRPEFQDAYIEGMMFSAPEEDC